MKENVWTIHAKRQEKKALELYKLGLPDEAKKHADLAANFYKNGGVHDYQPSYQQELSKRQKKSKRC